MPKTILHVLAVGLLSFGTAAFAQPSAASPGEVERRAEEILAQMTLEEKIDYIGGVDGFFIRDVPRLKLPRIRMADGPLGVRNFGPATAMAAGIGLAATWNPDLAERVGHELGRDARAKGVHILLAPGVNIYRAPMNGRNHEYFGEDPFLVSRIAVSYIEGVQAQGVSATIKHFAGNNSEFGRNTTDSQIDERALREVYLPAFEAAVKEAKVGAIMDAYNLTNGEHMTQNGYLNTDVVRKDWGFDGIMMSDWVSTYDGVAAANGGLDLEMPSARFMNRETLLPAIEQGKVSRATIDEKVRRILRVALRFGWFDREQTDASIPRYNLKGRQVALEAAREAIVLLKNDGNLLPLAKPRIKSIALVGPNAYPAIPVGGGSGRVQPFAATSLLEALSQSAAPGADVYYHPGLSSLSDLADATGFVTAETGGQPGLNVEVFNNADLSGAPASTRTDRVINIVPPPGGGGAAFGAAPPPPQPTSTRWSGYFTPRAAGSHLVAVDARGGEFGGDRLSLDGRVVIDNWDLSKTILTQATVELTAGPHKFVFEHVRRVQRGPGPRIRVAITAFSALVDPAVKTLAAKADVAVVAVGFDPDIESEGGDRSFQLPRGQEALIQEVAAANKNTIVVLNSGGGVDMSAWLDRVPALVAAWYPGQEGGTALAEILLGEVNPSGRLPVTFERRLEDNPSYAHYYPTPGTKAIPYKEGIFVGYRGYEKNGTQPQFAFGYGLSYTAFKYGNLTVRPRAAAAAGGASAPEYDVSFDVTNAGARAGAEVAQVYVGEPQAKLPRPPKELKGFTKVTLRPGETKRVSVVLDRRALSYYDPSANRWVLDGGDFDVLVGRSSEQIELRGKLTVPGASRSSVMSAVGRPGI
jgi:beta-glucosidase